MAENETSAGAQTTTVEQLNHVEILGLIPMFTFLLLISIIGIPGNGLVCYIYRNKYGASSSRWFIFFLAAVDLVMCVIIVPCEITTSMFQYTFTNSVLCKLTAFLNNWSLMTLAFILIIVSVDRYRKVCRSLGWQIDYKKAKILSVASVGAAFLISLPLWWVYGIHKYEHVQNNITVSECSFTESASNGSSVFYFVLFGMFLFVGSLTAICVLYCFIGRDIKLHLHKEQVRRQVSLSASMAQRDRAIRISFSPRNVIVSLRRSVKFRESKLQPKPDNHCENQRKVSPPSNDGSLDDQVSTNFTDGDTFDFEKTPPPSNPIERKKTKRIRRARARKATYSMFLISLAFVLSYLPLLLLLLIRSVDSDFESGLSAAGRAVYKFFLRSYFLNCSINPFIYGLSDSRFRESFKEVLQKFCSRLNCKQS